MPDPSCKRYPKSTESERQSFQMAGPQLFNSLPKTKTTEEFKEKLDQFLSTLHNHHKIDDMVSNICNQVKAKPSNSLFDVISNQKNIHVGG